jgi:hypothetical protein
VRPRTRVRFPPPPLTHSLVTQFSLKRLQSGRLTVSRSRSAIERHREVVELDVVRGSNERPSFAQLISHTQGPQGVKDVQRQVGWAPVAWTYSHWCQLNPLTPGVGTIAPLPTAQPPIMESSPDGEAIMHV